MKKLIAMILMIVLCSAGLYACMGKQNPPVSVNNENVESDESLGLENTLFLPDIPGNIWKNPMSPQPKMYLVSEGMYAMSSSVMSKDTI